MEKTAVYKPTICLDFDGTLHSYTSGWQGHDVCLDPPVPGALDFLQTAVEHFRVAVYSTRSAEPSGRAAMRNWCAQNFGLVISDQLWFPDFKPPAAVTIDDRALTFDGTWPSIDTLRSFRTWQQKNR